MLARADGLARTEGRRPRSPKRGNRSPRPCAIGIFVAQCCLYEPMLEQHLDHADIGLPRQQMRREAAPQHVHRCPLVELGRVGREATSSATIAGEAEQIGPKHDIAVLATPSLLDPYQQAGAAAVSDIEVDHPGDPPATAVGDTERSVPSDFTHGPAAPPPRSPASPAFGFAPYDLRSRPSPA